MSTQIICPTCKKDIPDDSAYCPFCGKLVDAMASDSSKADASEMGVKDAEEMESRQESQMPSAPIMPKAEVGEVQLTDISHDEREVLGRGQSDAAGVSQRSSNSSSESRFDSRSIMSVLAGVALTVAGAVLFVTVDSDLPKMSFGGDAYTYLYRGVTVISRTLGLIARCLGVAMGAAGVVLATWGVKGRQRK